MDQGVFRIIAYHGSSLHAWRPVINTKTTARGPPHNRNEKISTRLIEIFSVFRLGPRVKPRGRRGMVICEISRLMAETG